MEALLSRYRNLTVLLIVVVAQLLYLAYQVKTNRDERLIRVWAVTAVTPMAGIVEAIRHNTIGFLQDYFILLDVREQNRKLKSDNDRLRMENVYYRNELATAEHARALTLFQARTPSKTVAARVIGNSTVETAKAVFVDRGATSGIEKGMAVVTPDGVVGKVIAVYPLVSQVLLITDPTFKVGVESQKGHVHGVLDCGTGKCEVEQIQNEDKVSAGEWFFTSGEDRIFPKGFPVGTVVSSQPGQGMRDIKLNLSGAPGGVEEVLVVLQGVHQAIPSTPPENTESSMLPAPPAETGSDAAQAAKRETEADKVLQKYDEIGKQEGHVFGGVGSNLPNFNVKPEGPATQAATPAAGTSDANVVKTGSQAAVKTSPPSTSAPSSNPAPKPGPSSNPAPKPATAETRPPMNSGPVLPLGAPRHKAVPPIAQPQAQRPPAAPPRPADPQ
ncbi:MAG: rod shape-determining protein MreC [Acidobacteriaceae bacterium]|nr:rod shape-determining protein MreC [Acidobacteriaceae bacterium]